MSAQWYWLVGEDEFGPFTSAQLQKLARNGQLTREHFVRPEASPTWLEATDIPGLFPAETAKPAKPEGASRIPPPAPRVPTRPPAATPPPEAPVARTRPRGAPPAVAAQPAVPVAVPVVAGVPTAVRVPQPVAAETPDEPPSTVEAPPAWDVASPPVSHSRREVTTAIRSKRSQQQTYLVIGLLGTFIVLCGVALAMFLTSGTKPERPAVSAGAPKKPEPEPEKPVKPEDVETDPGDPAKPAKAAGGAEAAKTGANPAALAAVTQWFEAPKKIFVPGKFVLEVTRVWKTTEAKSSAVHVEVQVTNMSTSAPMDFRGWAPAAGATPAAELYDDADTRLMRLDKVQPTAQRLPPRELATQTFDFALPKGDFKKLRLILAGTAVGRAAPIGFEIPPALIGDGAPEPLAARPAADSGKKKTPREPDLADDLKRQIQDDEKTPEMADDAPAPASTMPEEEAKPKEDPEPKEKPADLKLEIENEDFKE